MGPDRLDGRARRGDVLTAEAWNTLARMAAQGELSVAPPLELVRVPGRGTVLRIARSGSVYVPFEAIPYPGTGDYVLVGQYREDPLYPWKDSIRVVTPSEDKLIELTAADSVQIAADSWIYYLCHQTAGTWTATLKASDVWPPTDPDDGSGRVYLLVAWATFAGGIVDRVYQIAPPAAMQTVYQRPVVSAFAPVYSGQTPTLIVSSGSLYTFPVTRTTLTDSASWTMQAGVSRYFWAEVTVNNDPGHADQGTVTVDGQIQQGSSYPGFREVDGTDVVYRVLLGHASGFTYYPAAVDDITLGILPEQFVMSVVRSGDIVRLVNDEYSPGAGTFYSANASGAAGKGWKTLAELFPTGYSASEIRLFGTDGAGGYKWYTVQECSES